MNNTVTICNVNLHRDAKMSPTELVAKLKYVEVLRTWNSNSIYSYYLTSKYEITNLKYLHKSINSGIIKFESSKEERRKYIFGLTMNKHLFEWFKKYKYKEILDQIYAWMAFEYFYNENKRDIYDDQFEKKILFICKNIILTNYSRFFDVAIDKNGIPYPLNKDIDWSTLVEKYNQCFESYCNIKPDKILDKDNMKVHKEKYGLANYTFNFSYSYLSDTDWERIVKGDSKDSMNRVESTRFIYGNWSNIYCNYLSKGHYVIDNKGEVEISHIAKNSGFLYILSNPAFMPNLYKIGFTSLKVELRSNQLYKTGVPLPFKIEKVYNVFDICRLETIIHEKLKIYRINNRREFFHCKKSIIIECINSIIQKENTTNNN